MADFEVCADDEDTGGGGGGGGVALTGGDDGRRVCACVKLPHAKATMSAQATMRPEVVLFND